MSDYHIVPGNYLVCERHAEAYSFAARLESPRSPHCFECEREEYNRKRARRHAWFTASAIILALCVIVGVCLMVRVG